ncbi:MAG TPA: hypothetical protein VJR89_30405 [Polyangiales bacterium]|nr:hypothetical protein [Polyangiales bacterium]
MSGDDPVPLKAGGDAAPELVGALYALGEVRPDRARIARIAERVADASSQPKAARPNKLRDATPLLAGIAFGLVALSWLGYQLAH